MALQFAWLARRPLQAAPLGKHSDRGAGWRAGSVWTPLVAGLGLLFLQVGCVNKAAYQKVNDDLTAANQQARVFYQDLETCKQRIQANEQQLATCTTGLQSREAALDELKKATSDLTSNLPETRAALALQQALKTQQSNHARMAGELAEHYRTHIQAGQVEVLAEPSGLRIRIPESALFDANRLDLKPEGKTLLEDLSRTLEATRDSRLQVEAHTDNQPVKKTAKFSNGWELTSAHALDVTRFMVGAGIPASRISAAAFGEFSPLVPAESSENPGRNRRIEIVIHTGAGAVANP